MTHKFNVEIAKEYGILEAVLIEHIYFWILKNIANNQNYYDGEYWTYNSVKAFADLFPYASQRQIHYALEKLKKKGILKTGNYNKKSYDKTLWYTFTKKGKTLLQNCKMDFTNLENASYKIV